MSWSGPVAGAAPYQPPPYANGVNGQPSFGFAQTHQYGQQPGYNQPQAGYTYPPPAAPPQSSDSRPLKKKGNPIITRYPPPPGYRGPAQPQGPFGTTQYPNQYQAPQQTYPQGAPVPPVYPNQPYQGPSSSQTYSPQSYGPPQNQSSVQTYPQPGYQQTQNHQWPQPPQQTYPPQPAGPQPANYPAPGYPQSHNAYQQYPSHLHPINTNQQTWNNAQTWPQPPGSATYPVATQYNSFSGPPATGPPVQDPNANPTPASAHPSVSQPTPTNTQPPSATSESGSGEKANLYLAWDDWDFDFEGAIWPKANEPVDPNLSLGVITWRPAKQVTRALPSTFEEAEAQSLRPPAEKLGNGESVSLYFTVKNSYEAFVDVRETDEWYNIRNDPAFVVFTDEEMKQNLISLEDCLALRDRPDEPLEEGEENADQEMQDSSWSVMDNLEQALSGDMEDVKRPAQRSQDATRDQAQEDLLAKLGVTGSPKPPSDEPISIPIPLETRLHASLPEKPPVPPSATIPPRPEVPPQRAQTYDGHRNPTHGPLMPRPYGSLSSIKPHQPPTGLGLFGHTESWNSNPQMQSKGNNSCPLRDSRGSSVHSEASNRTAVGSELGPENPTMDVGKDAPPVPQLKRSDSSFARKRSYEDTDQEDGQTRQRDDHTKRKRRSQVDAAYSRR